MSDSIQTVKAAQNGSGAVSIDSTAPLSTSQDSPTAAERDTAESPAKSRKRDFFRLKKKGDDDKKKMKAATETKTPAPLAKPGTLSPTSPLTTGGAISSARSHPYGSPTSPNRQALRSASPRTHSPASSMIFERNVQEDAPTAASPQIPSHIHTENHIAPALDATSEAITNAKLSPDTVEIVTHATHQPAAAAVPGHLADQSLASSVTEEMLPRTASFPRLDTDNVSAYASLDTGDVRRLSFISFADVVHAEQEMEEKSRRDSTHIASLAGHPALTSPRSPSPLRSPDSSQLLGTSPGTSVSPSVQEGSPPSGVRGISSPLPRTSSPVPIGEVKIETMRQALRHTGSGDLSAVRSPTSDISVDPLERPLRS